MEQFSIAIFPKDKAEGSSYSQEGPKVNIVSHYKEKNMHILKSSHDFYPKVRVKYINKPIMISPIDKG